MASLQRRALAGLFLSLLAALVLVAPARAQDPFSIEAIQAKLTALEGAEGESDVAQLDLYRQALASLQQASEANKRTQQFQAETAEAPGFLETLRAELAQAPVEPAFPDETGFSLTELESRLNQALAEQASESALVQELDTLAAFRTARNAEIPKELATSQQTLGVAMDTLEATATTAETDARRTQLLAQIEEHRARIAALEAERVNIDARREVLPLRRDRAARRLALADKQVAHWKVAVDTKRAAEGDAAAQQASERLVEITESFPALAALAATNHELAARRSGSDGLPVRIAAAQDDVVATRELLAEVNRRFKAARRRIAAGGLTEGMGLILRRDYEWLAQAIESRALRIDREERLSEAQLELIAIEEARFSAVSTAQALDELIARLDIEDASPELIETARDLLLAERDLQDAVLEELGALTSAYYDQRELADEVEGVVEAYTSFIEKRILWVRSSPLNPTASVKAIPRHLQELLFEVPYLPILVELRASASSHLLKVIGLGVVLVLLFAVRKRLDGRRYEWGTRVRSYRTDKYVYTFFAIAATAVIALPLPLFMWAVGWLLGESPVVFGRALGSGFVQMAFVWWALRFLRGLLVERGVGPAHFRWPAATLAGVRRELLWLEPVSIVLGLAVIVLQSDGTSDWNDSLGRLAFIGLMVSLALATHRVMKAGQAAPKVGGRTFSLRARQAYAIVATLLPLALAVMAMAGYYYTALQFEVRLRDSFGYAILLTIINALLLRWLFMARRTLAVNQALDERKRREEEEESGEDGMQTAFDIEKVDIPAVDAQTRQLFKSSLTMATVLGFYFIWASVLPALKGLDRVQLLPEVRIVAEAEDFYDPVAGPPSLGTTVPNGAAEASAEAGSANVVPPGSPAAMMAAPAEADATDLTVSDWDLTLADLLLAVVFGLLVLVAARNLPALLELALLQRLPLDSGSRYAISTIVRYVILILGVSLVSGTLGLSWQKVQWLAAALTFGLAFGLQEIFANFVSGIIILLERPIRVGDIVTVNGIEGRVSQLRMRATTIVDYSLRELLIPNKEFITTSVINWTLSDPVTRIIVKVGVAYGSDTKKARGVLLRVARDNPDVLSEPEPQAFFMGFGDSTLDFELRVFTSNRQAWAAMVDQLHFGVDDAFRRAGIEIAFPQRDLHIRSVDPSFHQPPTPESAE